MTNLGMRAAVAGGATALLVPVLAAPAAAHVTANPDEADSSHATTRLRIGHGCDGAPTTEVRVQIPEGVTGAGAEVVPGWEVEREEEDGRVTEVAWTGGSLPDSQFQEFGLSFQITEDAADVLWLPTIQECDEGSNRWIEIPDSVDGWGELDEPAPYVINNTGGGGSDQGHGDQGHGDEGSEGEGSEGEGSDADGSEPEDTDTDTAAATDDGADPMAVTALVLAIVAVLAAGAALVLGRRRS